MHPAEQMVLNKDWASLGWWLWDIFLLSKEDSLERFFANFLWESLSIRERNLLEEI